MTTYSTNLGLTLIGVGEEDGTWGGTTNTNLGTLIEQAISGYETYACTGGDDTITIPDGADGTARNMYLELTGTGGGNLIVPSNKKLYFIYNNTTSGAVTVKVAGQTGVSVPNGIKIVLVCNGTDIVEGINYVPLTLITTADLTVTNALTVLGTAAISGDTTISGNATFSGTNINASGVTLKFSNFNISNSGTSLNFTSVATYTGAISTTTMTVSAVATGNVIYGQTITGTGVTAGTTVAAQLTSTETAAASPTYSSGGAIGDSSFVVNSASGISIGQMIDGLGVPTGTYVLNIDGTTIYLGDRTGAAVTFTIQAAGTYNFRAAQLKGTYTVSASQTVSSTTITGTKTVAQITNTGLVTSNAV